MGPSLFPKNIPYFLGILNSKLNSYLLNIINSTVAFKAGDIGRLPIPKINSPELETFTIRAITLSIADCMDDETTYDFIVPPFNSSIDRMITVIRDRHNQCRSIENQIDKEVFRLYEISEGRSEMRSSAESGSISRTTTPISR